MIVTDVIVIFIIIVLVLCIIYQDGWTALIFASQDGHKEVVKLLLDHGANKDLQSKVSIIYVVSCMYVCMNVCMYVWINGCLDACKIIDTSTHTYIHIYIHTHTHMYMFVL